MEPTAAVSPRTRTTTTTTTLESRDAAYSLTCPNGATQDDLNACMEPVHVVLERIRSRRPLIKKTLLPVLFFSHAELSLACNAYKLSRSGCPFDYVQCSSSNATLRAIQTDLANFCDDVSQQRQHCVQSVQREHRRCVKSLLTADVDDDDAQNGRCDALYEFYGCFAAPLQARCGTSVIANLVKATNSYGCSADRLSDSTKQTEAECSPEDKESISECFAPLEGLWKTMRVQNADYNRIGFPLFHFAESRLQRMCTIVTHVKDTCAAVQRCPSQPIVQFANALLGYACGHQAETFFKHFKCIQQCVHDQPTCTEYVNGAWEPGYHKEACLRMPQFLQCLIPSVAARCGPEAIAVLAQSIRQYWCDIGSILDVVAIIKSSGVDMDERLAVLALSASSIVDPSKHAERSTTLAPASTAAAAVTLDAIQKFPVTIRSKNVVAATTVDLPPSSTMAEPEPTVGCSRAKENQVRQCLEPVFKKMLELHRVQKLENYSFPLYHYGKREILELCDLYATAFLQCPFGMFQECAKDSVLTAANAMLGYFCSPQHVTLFHDHYDCISLVIRNRRQCDRYIVGAPLMHSDAVDERSAAPTIDCDRIERFYECAKQAVDRGCPQMAVVIFKQSLQQFGCRVQ